MSDSTVKESMTRVTAMYSITADAYNQSIDKWLARKLIWPYKT